MNYIRSYAKYKRFAKSTNEVKYMYVIYQLLTSYNFSNLFFCQAFCQDERVYQRRRRSHAKHPAARPLKPKSVRQFIFFTLKGLAASRCQSSRNMQTASQVLKK